LLSQLLFKNGTVVDGSGSPRFRSDVLVNDGRIEDIGEFPNSVAEQTIDIHDRVLCPGFIDMHSHSDIWLLSNPRQESKIMQGVTTEVLGQDGLSYAPASPSTLPLLRRTLTALNGDCHSASWDWTSVGDFLERFDGKISVNICYMVPHAAVRLLVIGPEGRKATQRELERMRDLVREGMSEGAVGFSTGLTYTPCAFADTEELIACSQGVVAEGGYFAPHLRSYGRRFGEAIEEALSVGRKSGVPVHFTHFHCSFEVNRDRAEALLARLDRARNDGIDVTIDSYPYTAASTFLAGFFPSWVHAGGPDKFLARIASRVEREKIRREMEEEGCDGCSHVPIDWANIVISGVRSKSNQKVVGYTVVEMAREKGKSPFDWTCDLLQEENMQVSCLAFIGHEKNVQTIMKHPSHMVGTDGLLAGSRPHPRAYGTFARYLQYYTRELKILTLEECIRKMTSLPAARLGLHNRGIVRKGMVADLVVFDPERIEDTATYENPRSHPHGIEYVLVNGRVVVAHGTHTGVLAGRVLTTRS
jgi:N-acyl-D-amino-acid deacylase